MQVTLNLENLNKAYQPAEIEKYWAEAWEKAGFFVPSGTGKPYCIMIPPPNVTGSLHMGHAFQQTLMDILIRMHRMQGDNTLWQAGTDHAGIATQMVVERQLASENASRQVLGREKFIERVWQWKQESGGKITQQLRRLGASLDWSRERFTLDSELSDAVQEVFIRLYEEGLIYRRKRLVNWDPQLLTALSDLEVESEEESGFLWYIRYPLANSKPGKDHVIVATSRPETLFGDVAVAVNPEDPRYQALIGQTLKLPLTNREIPIIADESVLLDFGTGCVKITPGHDFNDFLVGERHHLPLINIFTQHATLNETVPEIYQGLDRFVARKKVVADLKALELIEKIENHTLKLPRGDRSGVVLEPRLTDQWYMKMGPLAEPAIEVVKSGKVRFVPENWEKTYFEWLNNIQDWCISRQLWWGHRIPAWYTEAGHCYVGANEATIRQKHPELKDQPLHQDPDVLDTWFSSALWPFSTLGWPKNTEELKTFYPTQVLITGFDIIFFWVARMVMLGLKFTGKIPFHEVYINGLIQDPDGQKMTKTKGNVIDPLDVVDGIDLQSLIKKRTQGLMQPQLAAKIEKETRAHFPTGIPAYGMDALRFSFATFATQSRYIRFDLNRVEGYRHFCNKIWNAVRFVFTHCENLEKPFKSNAKKEFSLADSWIESRFQATTKTVLESLQVYRFDLAAQAIYDFTWYDYCDWYLELTKPLLSEEDSVLRQGCLFTLITTFEKLLRLLHPFMPFITETLWQAVKLKLNLTGDTIMLQPYPVVDTSKMDASIDPEIDWLKTMILGARNIRGEMNISPRKALPVLLLNASETDRKRLDTHKVIFRSLAKVASIDYLAPGAAKPASATALIGSMELLIPIAGVIDKTAEIARLQKEIDKKCKDLERIKIKLDNPNFVKNAPSEVVQQDQQLAKELVNSIQTLEKTQKEISAL